MPPITDPTFLTTYSGQTITRFGITYVWVNGKYEVSSQAVVGTGEGFQVSKKVFLKFYGIVEPSVNLTGADLKVFVDGQEWTGNYRVENQTSVQIQLDEPYIVTQRLITFETTKGTPKVRYVVKSRVNSINDVVIAKIGIAEEIPILGTFTTLIVTNPTGGTGGGSSGTGTSNSSAVGASTNYEATTSDVIVDFFNQTNDQKVEATIGEVVGPLYE